MEGNVIQIEQDMEVNGKIINKKDMVYIIFLMVKDMKGNGRIIKKKDME